MKAWDTKLMDEAQDLCEYLKNNYNCESEAVQAGELAATFSTDKRGIRNRVNFLRSTGVPICSSQSGYWYSEEPGDIQKTIDGMSAKITGIQKAITGLKVAKENMGNTGEIEI